ncbi:hypothetical protein R3I93_016551 [Phoxinus phoxinus]|uniref:Uncharacterized protein n=1 Tax=Phoxinus phoxinus TaxID=58324 RepID=A0AAN9CQG0_9TELE
MCFFLPLKEKVNVKGTVLECEWMMFIPPSDVQHYLRAVFSHVSDCNSLADMKQGIRSGLCYFVLSDSVQRQKEN